MPFPALALLGYEDLELVGDAHWRLRLAPGFFKLGPRRSAQLSHRRMGTTKQVALPAPEVVVLVRDETPYHPAPLEPIVLNITPHQSPSGAQQPIN